MEKYAQVITTVERIDGVGEIKKYHWLGDPHAPIFVDWKLSGEVKKLPWKLRLINSEFPWTQEGIYIREDAWVPFGIYFLIKDRVGNFFFGIKCRIIYTFHVWGMGRTPTYKIPEWKDIFQKEKKI